jgi:hypothetical protein
MAGMRREKYSNYIYNRHMKVFQSCMQSIATNNASDRQP